MNHLMKRPYGPDQPTSNSALSASARNKTIFGWGAGVGDGKLGSEASLADGGLTFGFPQHAGCFPASTHAAAISIAAVNAKQKREISGPCMEKTPSECCFLIQFNQTS
jgi:hypothetical protein